MKALDAEYSAFKPETFLEVSELWDGKQDLVGHVSHALTTQAMRAQWRVLIARSRFDLVDVKVEHLKKTNPLVAKALAQRLSHNDFPGVGTSAPIMITTRGEITLLVHASLRRPQ